jgi:hypothetical protein
MKVILLVLAVALLSITGATIYQATHGVNETVTVIVKPGPSPTVNLLPTRTGLPSTETQYVQRFG